MKGSSNDKMLLAAAALVFVAAIIVGGLGYNIAQNRLSSISGVKPVVCGGHPYSVNLTSVRLTYFATETTYLKGGEQVTQPLGPVIFVASNADCKNGTLMIYYYTMQTGIRPAILDVKNAPQSFYVLLPQDILSNRNYFNRTSAASTSEGVWKTRDMYASVPQQIADYNGNIYNISMVFKYDGNTGALVEAQRSLILAKPAQLTNGTVVKSVVTMRLAGLDFAAGTNNTYSYTSIVKSYIGSVYAAAALVAAGLIGLAYLWGLTLEGLRVE